MRKHVRGWAIAPLAALLLAASCAEPEEESAEAAPAADASTAEVAAADVAVAATPADAAVDPLRAPGEWVTWGGDYGNSRYSALDQITADNVGQLEVVWTRPGEDVAGRPNSNWKATPIYVDGVMYIPTGGTQVAAIDPATGQDIWLFTPDPYRNEIGRQFSGSTRAVSYWTDGEDKRILLNSIDGRLISIDAETGEADPNFGENGYVDLNENLLSENDPRDPDEISDVNSTAPGVVVGDTIVVQVITTDTIPRLGAVAPGYVRGYDVRTGALKWTFHTIPLPGEFGHDTWDDPDAWSKNGAASVWTMLTADPELGYVYLPVESAMNNFSGEHRLGDGLFGETIVCLDAETGERVWHFQILHHGVWDYDIPAAPLLHDIDMDGRTIKAITVLTKQGMSFVFDRETGEPVWPIEEREVPVDLEELTGIAGLNVPGEVLSPTQPFPTRPPPYSNLGFAEEDVLSLTEELHAEATELLSNYILGPMYTPPPLASDDSPYLGTLVYPNYGGGSNWNGGAVDLETNVMFVPTRNTYMTLGMVAADPERSDFAHTAANAGLLRLENGLPANNPPWALVTATDMNEGEHIWSRSIGGAPTWVRELPELQGREDLNFDAMGQISVRPAALVTSTLLFLAESGNIGGDPGGPMFRAYDKATGDVIAELVLPGLTSGAPMTYMHEGNQYISVVLSAVGQPAQLVTLALPGARDAAALASTGSTAAATGSTTPSAPMVEATEAQLASGAATYTTNCAVCHGADGGGVPGGNAPSLATVVSLDDAKLMISGGSAEMPGMAAILTEEEIDAVARYVIVGLGEE
ncbi:MAG: PQQ-binding-like beta-propeller repeat protein [Maricaulaceae bacterium]